MPKLSFIHIAADHGGYPHKDDLKTWLSDQGYVLKDHGAFALDQSDDYPQYAKAVALAVATRLGYNEQQSELPEKDMGILLCRSGAGMCMAANRFPNARAVVAITEEQARHARNDNDANILILSGDFSTLEEMKLIVAAFLQTEFSSEERHARRIKQIEQFS